MGRRMKGQSVMEFVGSDRIEARAVMSEIGSLLCLQRNCGSNSAAWNRGDHLDQKTFHERDKAMPPGVLAPS